MQSPCPNPSSLPSLETKQYNNTFTMQLPRDMLYFIVSYISLVSVYFKMYRWIPAQHVSSHVPSAAPLNRILDINASLSQSDMGQWRSTVAKMINSLYTIQAGSALILPATIALFLQPSILDSTLLRALTASSILLSGASIASASVLVALKDRMLSKNKRDQWIDASVHPKKWSSIGFWGCLTWPYTSLAWSIAIFVFTILFLCLAGQPNPTNTATSKAGIGGVIVIFSVATVICFAFYQQFMFLMQS